MRIIIVTGLSGAGKSEALRSFEDMGYFCVDNLPPGLIPTFLDLCTQQMDADQNVALVVDCRGGDFFHDIYQVLYHLKDAGHTYELLYLDADIATLVRRFDFTRRIHPLQKDGLLEDAIRREAEMLGPLKESANRIVDTSNMTARQLRATLREMYMSHEKAGALDVSVVSFGYKYGVPLDADMLFDVRFLPNPFYIDNLKTHTGQDEDVRAYIQSFDETEAFLVKAVDLLAFTMPLYMREGKLNLVIGVGCTGGMHRSVMIAEEITARLLKDGHKAHVTHRDIMRDRGPAR